MNNWGRELVTKILATSAPATAVLVRLIVGAVFLSEGIQKFLFPAALGVGRFAKIGIPWPGFTAPFDGVFEIGGGLLILLGLATRLATVPLIIDMLVAIATTKLPMLFKSGFWPWRMRHAPTGRCCWVRSSSSSGDVKPTGLSFIGRRQGPMWATQRRRLCAQLADQWASGKGCAKR